MKVLLTGHSGFIGQHLLKLLLKRRIKLFITKYKNLRIPQKKKINIIDLSKIQNSFESFDLVIHCAWKRLDNYNSNDHTKKIFVENLNFLKKLILFGAQNIVVLGTCFELGKCADEVTENAKMVPVTAYGVAKKKLLLNLISLQKRFNFNLTWIRIFYLFGENQRDKSLFSQITKSNKHREKFFFLTEGMQQRDYLDVKVLAKKIIEISFIKKNIGILNVCSGRPITIKELVNKWKKKFKWKVKFIFGVKKIKKYEPYRFWGSIRKLNYILNNN
jgi:dTDP-6-deoxy-L-talose 4-dehydrogenase (NAD+)